MLYAARMKKTSRKKLSLSMQTLKQLDPQIVGGLDDAQSVVDLGDSCYEAKCRLTDAISLRIGKTCTFAR